MADLPSRQHGEAPREKEPQTPPAQAPPPEVGVGSHQTRRWSLTGRLTGGFLAVLTLVALLAAAATQLALPPWLTFLAILLCGLPLGAWLMSRLIRPVQKTLRGLESGISAWHDRDFSVRLSAERADELGDLVRLYNAAGQTLQQERHEVRQKELLLATALNRSPAAVILVNALDRVIYANAEARRLLLGGAKLAGHRFAEIRTRCPQPMQEILEHGSDGLFTVPLPEPEKADTYHVAQRTFLLNRRRHTLVLLNRLTDELGRQEAQAWKNVIRVICHELNNSLAPVSSLVHSAKTILDQPQRQKHGAEIFFTIEERLAHLKEFIEGYARFARLPKPRKEWVLWPEFFATAASEIPDLDLRNLPAQPGYFDRAQMQQVVINLLKNAVEASPEPSPVQARVHRGNDGACYLKISDRGGGMSEQAMKSALLPFYSTKHGGSGLGLPLCREILEAHGGRIELRARHGGGTVVTCWLPGGPD